MFVRKRFACALGPVGFIRRILKLLVPYGVMRIWLLRRYAAKIDEPLCVHRGFLKRLRRLVKFALPCGLVRNYRDRIDGESIADIRHETRMDPCPTANVPSSRGEPMQQSAPAGGKVSVITVTCNNLAGLRYTANSVLAQTRRDFEWIVIDGGSTDGSVEYIRETLAPCLSHWCSERDSGIYDAMNKGIAYANGEYMCFMNAGDAFSGPTVLADVFARESKADVLYGRSYQVRNGKWFLVTPPSALPPRWFYRENLCHQAMFIRSTLMKQKGYDTTWRLYADWARWQEVQDGGGTFSFVPVTICIYDATGGTSATHPETMAVEEARLRLVRKGRGGRGGK